MSPTQKGPAKWARTASAWYMARRLQTQLLLWTTLIVCVSVVGTMEIAIRSNIQLLESNLLDRSETTLRSINQALKLGSLNGSDPTSMVPELRERASADRMLIRLDLIDRRTGDVAASSANASEAIVQDFSDTTKMEIREIDGQRAMITSKASDIPEYGMIAVTSLENVDRYASLNRRSIPQYSAILIVVVLVLMHFMYQRIVSKRLDELLDGIERARDGQAARIPDERYDEIGVIAKTLNGLITQVQSFNDELRRQIATATTDLNQRNVELEEVTRQMLEMQKQLLESERLAAAGQLAATFAHEIGSPMTSLSAHAQLLLEDSTLSPDQRESLTIILQQIQATVQIVHEMLESARRGPSDFVLTDINEILRNVIRLVRPNLMSQKIAVQTHFDIIPPVRGYPLYLQEVFLNVINNACDAMARGGQLAIRTWFDDGSELVHVSITDNGPGIDPAIVEKVFDHFVTTKAIGQGSGLGLGIVKEIVDSHRGRLTVAPAAGAGTEVHITFPVETASVLVS